MVYGLIASVLQFFSQHTLPQAFLARGKIEHTSEPLLLAGLLFSSTYLRSPPRSYTSIEY